MYPEIFLFNVRICFFMNRGVHLGFLKCLLHADDGAASGRGLGLSWNPGARVDPVLLGADNHDVKSAEELGGGFVWRAKLRLCTN